MYKYEFAFENSCKAYPFDTNNIVDASVFLDLRLNVTPNVSVEHVYISKIATTVEACTLEVSAKLISEEDGEEGDLVWLGELCCLPMSLDHGTRSAVRLISDDYSVVMEGFIVTGDLSKLLDLPSSLVIGNSGYDEDAAVLYSGCIMAVTSWCMGLKINDKIHTGVISIIAGDGVSFDVDDSDEDETVVTVYTPSQLSSDVLKDLNALTTESILTSLNDSYGTPIVSINSVTPDSEGNLTLTAGDGISLTPTDHGITLSSALTTDEINLVDDTATLVTNISTLNDRASTIYDYLTQVDNNVNTLNSNLLRL